MKTEKPIIDHLFRHHYGRMIATLTRIFGINNLELIEDAIQDTFIKALKHWQIEIPPNPEGWLTQAAKNRTIDILRKIKSNKTTVNSLEHNFSEEIIEQFFMDYQIEDSQLRMIFTACHPKLNPKEQIAFALKTIAGFGDNEIAVALLLKLETVKKRLSRARKKIKEESIAFAIPNQSEMKNRLTLVYNVLYLIFNEGFHSNRVDIVVRKELCSEAMRLCSLILKKHYLRTGEGFAHFGLFCFHAARIDSKISSDNLLVDLRNQDRKKWNQELIQLGNDAMNKALEYKDISPIHYEAAIAAEHVRATSFETTNWNKVLKSYEILHDHNPTDYSAMNLAIVLLQLGQCKEAEKILKEINPQQLENRAYLYYGVMAEYYIAIDNKKKALELLELTLKHTSNKLEKDYIEKKKNNLK